MAQKASRPGRALVAFALAVLAMYGALVAHGVWKPALGLDLQGGTRITLRASTATGEAVTADKLDEAVGIIDSRVNATGVAESEVAKQGDRNIVVEIPGKNPEGLVETVQQQAQLRFRLVAGRPMNGTPTTLPVPIPKTTGVTNGPGTDGAGAGAGAEVKGVAGKQGGTAKQGKAGGGKGTGDTVKPQGRAVSQGLLGLDAKTTSGPGDGPSDGPGDGAGDGADDGSGAGASGSAGTGPSESPSAAAPSTPAVPTDKSSVAELLAWIKQPDPQWQAKFQSFTCAEAAEVVDNPSKPLLACDADGLKYLLTPAIIEGTQLDDAGYGIPQNQTNYVVNLDFNGDATKTFAEVSRPMAGTTDTFAIVLDAEVLSAPTFDQPIVDGSAQITGNFSAAEAKSLANALKYGALPLGFEVQEVAEEGPTLAADQLSAGLWAGGLGLLLVLLYCLFYYRGLGLVVVASLGLAAAITYAAVILLSETAGFTLTLPGIAGLIVAVGITADSFIVYFERIRDEMREGKSLRVAVEAGWVRARATCLAADAVSLLAAVVLYIFAIGVVKGFAFALGISTLIDLVVFFLFTKPMVTWLARFPFFSRGHRFSGLSPDHVGIERIGVPVGRRTGATLARRTAGGVSR